MAIDIKNAIMQAKLEGVLHEIMVKTSCDNVAFNKDGTEVTLTSYLAEIMTTLATKDSTADREAAITALKQELLGDVPVAAYDTFTELAQYIEEHGEAADALTAAIGEKASAADLTAAIERIAGLEAKSHEHSNKDVLDGITADQIANWGKRKVYVQAAEPADLADGDIWLKIMD